LRLWEFIAERITVVMFKVNDSEGYGSRFTHSIDFLRQKVWQ